MRWKILRAPMMAVTMVLSPASVSTMSAAPRAASVAPAAKPLYFSNSVISSTPYLKLLQRHWVISSTPYLKLLQRHWAQAQKMMAAGPAGLISLTPSLAPDWLQDQARVALHTMPGKTRAKVSLARLINTHKPHPLHPGLSTSTHKGPTLCSRPTVHSHADVSALEGGGVVDAVSSHAHHVAALLQDLHDGVLVLREHLGKAVGVLHQLVHVLDAFQVDDALLGLQTPASIKARPGWLQGR